MPIYDGDRPSPVALDRGPPLVGYAKLGCNSINTPSFEPSQMKFLKFLKVYAFDIAAYMDYGVTLWPVANP
jgi:hypothetical protein